MGLYSLEFGVVALRHGAQEAAVLLELLETAGPHQLVLELERLTRPSTPPEDLRRRLELILPSLLAPARAPGT